jgi:hypothetical protein
LQPSIDTLKVAWRQQIMSFVANKRASSTPESNLVYRRPTVSLLTLAAAKAKLQAQGALADTDTQEMLNRIEALLAKKDPSEASQSGR